MEISVVIPAYNEEKRIGQTLKSVITYLDKKAHDYEIIIVNDCSKDQTIEIVNKVKNSRVRILNNEKNMGKGVAMRAAVEGASDTDIIVFLDGDGQHDTEDIPKVVAPIFQNKADFVIGSRYLPESKACGQSGPESKGRTDHSRWRGNGSG